MSAEDLMRLVSNNESAPSPQNWSNRMGRSQLTMEQRFWEKVNREGSGCWEWQACRQHNGYGQFYVSRHRTSNQAHRVAWELTHGPIPAGLWVLHHCDNPPCVRPDHLWVGDRADNMRDAVAKGRKSMNLYANKTHCKRGHPFDNENTHYTPNGHRRCLACQARHDEGRTR